MMILSYPRYKIRGTDPALGWSRSKDILLILHNSAGVAPLCYIGFIFKTAVLIVVTNQYNRFSPQLLWQIAALTAFHFLHTLCQVCTTYSTGNTSNYFLHKYNATIQLNVLSWNQAETPPSAICIRTKLAPLCALFPNCNGAYRSNTLLKKCSKMFLFFIRYVCILCR